MSVRVILSLSWILGLALASDQAAPKAATPVAPSAADRGRNTDEKFPRELVDFVAEPKEPIFTGAGPGHWDVRIRNAVGSFEKATSTACGTRALNVTAARS